MDSLKDRFCSKPFTNFEVNRDPENFVHQCCSAWLPLPIGKVEASTTDFQSIWNSENAKSIRESIHDGSFRYCSRNSCPHLMSNDLPLKKDVQDPILKNYIEQKLTHLPDGPRVLLLANDPSCNLSCPSCRTEKILFKDGPDFVRISKITTDLLDQYLPQLEVLNICGSGDPIGSPIYRKILEMMDGQKYPQLKINLTTNGQMLTEKMWDRLKMIHNNLSNLIFSVDAATEGTYRIVRRGGELPKAIENIRFLSSKRKQMKNLSLFRMDFVVQKLNFREMPDFVRLAQSLNANTYFSKIVSWNTYSKAEFPSHAIWDPEHPEFNEFLSVLRDPVFDSDTVYLGNLYELREMALRQRISDC